MRQMSIPHKALSRHTVLSTDACKYSTSLKNSFTCCNDKKGKLVFVEEEIVEQFNTKNCNKVEKFKNHLG